MCLQMTHVHLEVSVFLLALVETALQVPQGCIFIPH